MAIVSGGRAGIVVASQALVLCAALLSFEALAQIPQSSCFQQGGSAECEKPNFTPYTYLACGETGSFGAISAAWCAARGGTWSSGTCSGDTPRPRTEGDIVPYAQDFVRNWQPPCSGPSTPSLPWLLPGQSVSSTNCWSGSPAYTQGWERLNITSHWSLDWTVLDGNGQCTIAKTQSFLGSRSRTVECSPMEQWTTGATLPQSCVPVHSPRQPFCSEEGGDTVGNPCNVVTGAKRHVEVDYVGGGDFPLRFERTYNSLVWTHPGRKFWRHSYDRSVDFDPSGSVPVAHVHRQDGTSYLFREQAGVFVSNGDVSHRLEKLVNGSGQLTGWRLSLAQDDSVETYDADGRLVEIANVHGKRQLLEYSNGSTPFAVAPVPGLLIRVTDHYGRALELRYDAMHRITKLIDPAANEFLYAWNTLNTQDRLVTEVTYPEPLPGGAPAKKVYKYGDLGWGYHWTLTGVIDELGQRVSSWTYDSAGRISRTENAGAVNRYDILATNGWTGTQRRITNPRGVMFTYNYQIVDGVFHLSSISPLSGFPCPSCGPKSASYDTQGNVSQRVDWNGNRTNYGYDLARNLETSRTEGLTLAGATTPQTRTITTEWHATQRLPARIAEPLRRTTYTYNGDGGASCGYKSDGITLVPGVLCSKTVQSTTDANGSQAFGATLAGTPRTWSYTYNHNGC